MTIGELCNREVVVVNKGENALEAAKLMRDKGVRRAPVVGNDGELVGILTLDDVLDILAEALKDLVLLAGREQRRERETRA